MRRLLVLCLFSMAPVAGQAQETDHPGIAVVRQFTHAIDHFDLEQFMASVSDDISMFYPIQAIPLRVDGRADLRARQALVFEQLRRSFAESGVDGPPYFGLVPRDIRVQTLTPGAAVITWHIDRGTHLGRRTAVVAEDDGTWKIVSFHSSNMAVVEETGSR